MRKILLIFSLILSSLFCQIESLESTLLGSFGSVTINDNVYNQFSLRPEFSVGKLGMGFDIYFYLDEDGNLYEENWDFTSTEASLKTLVDKIYYVRWGQPFDQIYFRMGALPEITLGHGALVKGYSNVIDYPHVRRTGFDFKYQFSTFGLNIVHSDLKEFGDPGLFGIRTNFEYMNNLQMGISIVTDINQKNGLIDTDGDGYPDYIDSHPDNSSYHHQNQEYIEWLQLDLDCIYESDDNPCSEEINNLIQENLQEMNQVSFVLDEDPVSGIAIDLTYQINDNMFIYSEFAQLLGEVEYPSSVSDDEYDIKLGYGFIPIGFYGEFGPVIFTLDYRKSSERFIFNYWNENYDHNRVMINNDILQTKESKLYNYGSLSGANFGLSANIASYVNFSINYQYLKGDKWDENELAYIEENNNTFFAKIDMDTSKIPKLRIAEIFYQQYDVSNPFDFEPNENTLIGYNIGMDMADNMVFILKGRTTYVPDGQGKFESVKTTQIETQILF